MSHKRLRPEHTGLEVHKGKTFESRGTGCEQEGCRLEGAALQGV